MMSQRNEFEEWAIQPPREWDLYKYPNECKSHNWPGQYARYSTQCAWEAWQAASTPGVHETEISATEMDTDVFLYVPESEYGQEK